MAISSLDKKKVSDLKMSLKPIFFLHMYYIFDNEGKNKAAVHEIIHIIAP